MEGQEVEQTPLQLESASEILEKEQQKPVEEKQEEEEPELQKEKLQIEPDPEKLLHQEPEKVFEYEAKEAPDLESIKEVEAKKKEGEKQLELESPTQLTSDPENQLESNFVEHPELNPTKLLESEPDDPLQLEPEPLKQPELSPAKEPEPEPVNQPELSPAKEPEPEPVNHPELSPAKETEPEPVKHPEASPAKEPKPESVQQPEESPAKEPEPEPVKQPEVRHAKEPEPESAKPPEVNPVKHPEPEPAKQPDPEPEHVKLKEQEPEEEPEPLKQAEPEMQAKPEIQMDSEKQKPEAEGKVEPEAPEKQPEKHPETEEHLESEKKPEVEPAKQEEEMTQEEQQQASEVEAPAPIVPGSLAFAILEEEYTKTALRTSHTLIILRGLPGSGKTRLANAISEVYQGLCKIISADDHSVKPENLNSSVEGHKALDEAIVASCTSGTAIVIVDDINHTHGRLARLGELAEQHQYNTLFLEPRTEWGQDVEQLVQMNQRGLDKSQIQALKGPLEETAIPLFFGWFLCPSFQEKLKSMAKDFLKTLAGLEAFKKHLSDFTGEAEKEVDLEKFFQDKGMLHCTTKFCDYGKAEGSKEYAEQQSVKDRYGNMSELTLSALFLTPRTLGARVSLSEEQLQLWPTGAEKEAVPDANLPIGSRAHVTLGCAEGVEPVQTGLDLLELVQLQQQGQEGEQVEDLELGSLTYYGKGMWVLSLKEPTVAPACFSSYYGPKKEDGKKEAEKKKKFKCNLQ
ncbi:hypothetical protein JZ751_026470 [Albula glossodonta]|uniref:2',3'-cyclic-nucleotide 3'-phosphodiesterase n=1 Tax=Albula glossodonta TaxID=121402 RepID=A0A8T2PLN8_9TELE|nr:hypothetical protein JZ751_026470 [Albula glossodonta]